MAGSQVLGTIQWFSGRSLSLCRFSEVSLRFTQGNRSPSGSEPFPSHQRVQALCSPGAGYYHQNSQAQCKGALDPAEALRKVRKPPACGAGKGLGWEETPGIFCSREKGHHPPTSGSGAGVGDREWGFGGDKGLRPRERVERRHWSRRLGEKQTMEKVVNKVTKQERRVCAGTGKRC